MEECNTFKFFEFVLTIQRNDYLETAISIKYIQWDLSTSMVYQKWILQR